MTRTLTQRADALDATCWHWASGLARRTWLAAAFLLVLAVVTYLPGQTNLPAVDRTEGMVALSSRHIVETGNVWRPKWRSNIQLTRPIGTFWAQGLSLAAHAKPAWNAIATYRLPALLATVLAVVLMFLMARQLVPPVAAFMASTFVAVTPIVALHGQLAIAEALVLPMTIVAGLALLAIYQDSRRARWLGFLGLFWISLGLSTWFNALAVPLLTLVIIATLAVMDRRWTLPLLLQPWFGLPLVALISLPWLIAVWTIDGGALYRGFSFFQVLDALEGGQSMKFDTVHGVFILTLLLGFVPVAHLLGPSVVRSWAHRHDPTLRVLLAWLIAPIIALEIFSNKPPLYTVQAVMPAGALLVALLICRTGPYAQHIKAWPGMFWGTAVLLGVIAPVAFGGILWITDTPLTLLLIVGFVVLAALFMAAAWVSTKGYGVAWFALAAMGTFVFTTWFNGALMPGLANFWTAPQLAAVVERAHACHQQGIEQPATSPTFVISGFREPSLALRLAGQADISLPGEAAKTFQRAPHAYALIEQRQLPAFTAALASTPGDAPTAQRVGCVRSFNLARGCFLAFDVFVKPAPKTAAKCALPVQTGCRERQAELSRALNIAHCR